MGSRKICAAPGADLGVWTSYLIPSDDRSLTPEVVASLHQQYEGELRRFLLGVLRDPHAADDVLQATFKQALERGADANASTRKGWLFKVALNEALAWRRRQKRIQGVGFRFWQRSPQLQSGVGLDDDSLLRKESIEAVRTALAELPEDQRHVVRARIYDEKTFAEIAAELRLPIGTVLTRMRLAMEKLRRHFAAGDD